MSICPNCKTEIKEFRAYSEIVQSFKLDEKGEPLVEGLDYIEGYTGFECPECCEKLFDTEQEATEFLEENKLKIIVKEKIRRINKFPPEKLNQIKEKNADMSEV